MGFCRTVESRLAEHAGRGFFQIHHHPRMVEPFTKALELEFRFGSWVPAVAAGDLGDVTVVANNDLRNTHHVIIDFEDFLCVTQNFLQQVGVIKDVHRVTQYFQSQMLANPLWFTRRHQEVPCQFLNIENDHG